MRRVLVIAAHSDDETLGCGGTIARTIREGGDVRVVVVATTDPSLPRYRLSSAPDVGAARRHETRNACDVLGARSVVFGAFEELRLTPAKLSDIADFLRAQIWDFAPASVLIHHWADLHQDHRIVSEAAQIALRPSGAPGSIERVAAYGVDAASWMSVPRQTWFVPLEDGDVRKKHEALRCYRSEIRDAPSPRSCHAVQIQAGHTGVACGTMWAEGFEVVWARGGF